MKPFLLFYGDHYYPIGGWSDFKSSHETREEALAAAHQCPGDWWQIVDLSTQTVVEHCDRR